MGSKKADIQARTKDFALSILRLYALLPHRDEVRTIGRQMIRSGTSVGANIREGKRARSDAEMLSKIEVALQELEETRYWLELLEEFGAVEKDRTAGISGEARELTAILVTSCKTLRTRVSG